jgi:hypothetical protein
VEFLPDNGLAVPCEGGATIQRRPRRNHTPAFKAKVGLPPSSAIEHWLSLPNNDVHPNQVTSWQAQLEGGVPMCLVQGAQRCGAARPGRKSLHAKMASRR